MPGNRIDLAALRRKPLRHFLEIHPHTDPARSSYTPPLLTRRHLFGATGFVGIGVSPALKVLEDILTGDSFECDVTETRIAFKLHGHDRWVIDTRRFSGTPRLTWRRNDGLIRLELEGAIFPGTMIPADFVCELRRRLRGWHMRLLFKEGGFQAQLPFEKWLAGRELARSPVRLAQQVCSLGRGRAVEFFGDATAEFSPDWQFIFSGSGVAKARGFGPLMASDSVTLRLLDTNAPSIVTQPASRRTLVTLHRGNHVWGLSAPCVGPECGTLACDKNLFDTIRLEMWENSSGAIAAGLLAESTDEHSKLAFKPPGDLFETNGKDFTLPLVSPRYARLFDTSTAGSQQAFIAHFDTTPVYMRLHGCKFSLGNTIGTPPFEILSDAHTESLCCEPGIHSISVPLPDALSDPMRVPLGARLKLVAEKTAPRPLSPLVQPPPSPVAPPTQAAPLLKTQPALKEVVPPLAPAQPPAATPSSPVAPLLKTQPTLKEVVPPPAATQPPPGVSPLLQEKPISKALFVKDDFRSLLEIPGPLAVLVVRHEDLLVLAFEFRNLKLQLAPGKPPILVRDRPDQPARLVVDFPPQHIAEQAFYEQAVTKEPVTFPLQARIAGGSRLIFELPPEVSFIPYTLEQFLDWSKLQQVVAPVAVPPAPPSEALIYLKKGIYNQLLTPLFERSPFLRPQSLPLGPPRQRNTRPEIVRVQGTAPGRELLPSTSLEKAVKIGPLLVRPPAPPQKQELKNYTTIEAPYRLFLSPSVMAGWSHAAKAVIQNGRFELWHTRLGVRAPDGSVNERDDYYRTLRAIWSPDYNEDPAKGPGFYEANKPTPQNPFRMLPVAQDRHELVHLTANGNLDKWEQRVIRAERLMLSALGAWLNVRYAFDPAPLPLNVIEWRHVANMGRDQYVRVVRQGNLFPFGHKAALIAVTERKFEQVNAQIFAVLRYREFIVVQEPVKNYPTAEQSKCTFSQGKNFPYKSLRFKTLVTPNLDPKENSKIGNIPPGSIAFWPRVEGQEFKFHVLAEDWAGEQSELSVPLVFVTRDLAAANVAAIKDIRNQYVADPARRNVAQTAGQNVAFAPSKPGGDAVIETASLTLSAEVGYDPVAIQAKQQPACTLTGKENAPIFFPVINAADVSIRAAKYLFGTDITTIRYYDLYRVYGFDPARNVGEVFAELATPLPMRFMANKSGGVATPYMDITGLSRKSGPVGGNLQTVAQGNFVPTEFFKKANNPKDPAQRADQAHLLGSFFLGDIIASTPPSLRTEAFPPENPIRVWSLFSLETELKRDPLHLFVPWLGFDPDADPDKLPLTCCRAKLTVHATTKIRLAKPGELSAEAESSSRGSVTNFQISMFKLVIVSFKELSFVSKDGKKTDITVRLADVDPVRFGGALQFVEEIRKFLDDKIFSNLPVEQVANFGAKVARTVGVPNVNLGVFSLTNINMAVALDLPYINAPVGFSFRFSSRDDQFHVGVGVFGGGGFFGLICGMDGLRGVEGGLEFGGQVELDLGVASGGMHCLAGIYFKLETIDIQIAGFLRLGGHMSVLGLVTLSIEFKVELGYDLHTNTVWGEASLVVKVEVLLVSESVTLRVRKEFGGGGSSTASVLPRDMIHRVSYGGRRHLTQGPGATKPQPKPPRIIDLLSEADWVQYSTAFATD